MKRTTAPIRFAVIGARRGRTFIESARQMPCGSVELVALCDRNAEALAQWKDEPGIRLYSEYEQVLADPEIDAVCIATPVSLHASQSIQALNAGKHVLCEVTAVGNEESAWELIKTVEKTGLTYMMAENYCFADPIMQVQQMVEQGVFGELVYASGAYIHDVRELFFDSEGDLTWRGEVRKNFRVAHYATHSLGPVARWLGINRTDFLKKVIAMESRVAGIQHYVAKNHPNRAEYLAPDFWKTPDTSMASIRTEKGVLINIRIDTTSSRPHNMHRYELQGTKASFIWPEGPAGTEPLIWIEGRSPATDKGTGTAWEPLSKYRDEFDHPWWREHRSEASKAGHGGGDYFVLREFAGAVLEGRPPIIDVYDAVTWSCLTELSTRSVEKGYVGVDYPNFLTGKQ